MILFGRMITDTDTSFLDRRWILRHNWFYFKKFIHGICGFIGLTGYKFLITTNQMHLLFFVTIWDLNQVFFNTFFVINKTIFFFLNIVLWEREREREREKEKENIKNERKRRKKESNELLYFWASVVSCECMLGIIT